MGSDYVHAQQRHQSDGLVTEKPNIVQIVRISIILHMTEDEIIV
jgi:hypothetical protein